MLTHLYTLTLKSKKYIQHSNYFSYNNYFNKNLVRIIYTKNDYNNHPWPKYYSMNEDNQRADFKINKLGDKIILNPISGYCMYSSEICSNYKLDEKLKIKKINSYYFFYKK